jgi:hypothetical protein
MHLYMDVFMSDIQETIKSLTVITLHLAFPAAGLIVNKTKYMCE